MTIVNRRTTVASLMAAVAWPYQSVSALGKTTDASTFEYVPPATSLEPNLGGGLRLTDDQALAVLFAWDLTEGRPIDVWSGIIESERHFFDLDSVHMIRVCDFSYFKQAELDEIKKSLDDMQEHQELRLSETDGYHYSVHSESALSFTAAVKEAVRFGARSEIAIVDLDTLGPTSWKWEDIIPHLRSGYGLVVGICQGNREDLDTHVWPLGPCGKEYFRASALAAATICDLSIYLPHEISSEWMVQAAAKGRRMLPDRNNEILRWVRDSIIKREGHCGSDAHST